MMRRVEYGDIYEVKATTPSAHPSAQPLPPGLAVDLPYESAISISGRKLISVNLKMTQYLNPQEARAKNILPSRTDIEMKQELQVRIKGQVGRKIMVNIDFDDTTAEKRDISVAYKGDPEEVIQEAAFGDITMALPQTEFVGYSRQLFGAKVDAKYRNIRFIGFGSKTKGQSDLKRFTGNTALERREINDTSYIRFKYYRLAFGNDAIKRGSEKIYLDDRNPANNNITTSSMTVALTAGSTFYGSFDLLVPGQDYTVDYENGVVYFRKSILANYVIAVDYEKVSGGFLRNDVPLIGAPKILKDENNVKSAELKNYYSIGRNKLIRDNGRGNFILKIQDLNRNDVAFIGGIAAPKYPQDIEVDFEQGYFYFKSTTTPFLPDAYKVTPVSSYRIFLEYRYRFKTFQLRPGIVPHSEKVVMDGKTLVRDSDYFIDYDSGYITFYNEEKITENTVIEISYDYSLFGAAVGTTIVGMRGEVMLTPKIFVGSSYLYEFATQSQTLPDIKSTPASLGIWEVDSRITDIKIPFLNWGFSVGGEFAQSKRDPNTVGKAMVESMEGIKQEDHLSMFKDFWKYGVATYRYYNTDVSWSNEELYLRDINPNIDPSVAEKRQVLVVNYNTAVSSEVAIQQSISKTGLDFSKKIYLEAWIYGNKPTEISFDVGSMSEDIDGDGILDTEDKNGDGLLNQGEDTGISFLNPDGKTVIIGKGNNRLDTEDIDGDGVLRKIDALAGRYSGINLSGGKWEFIRIPLVISDEIKWQAVKQLRMKIKGSQSGQLKISQISFVGNRWEKGFATAGSTVSVSAINNEEDKNYKEKSLLSHPEYQKLYDITDRTLRIRREQALSIKYQIVSGTVSTRVVYSRPYDFSRYKKFKFFLYGDGRGGTFFIQAGNESNYFEFSIPVTWIGWEVITLEQVDKNRDGKPDVWESKMLNSNVRIVGRPNLNNISQIKAGMKSDLTVTGELWLNELFVEETFKKEGTAYRVNADLNVPGWAILGARKKEISRDFETFSGGLTNQDRLEESGYFNIPQFWLFKPSFLKWISMPVNTSLSKTLTITPAAIETRGDLVSIMEEGRVLNLTGSADTSLGIRYLPHLAGRYTRSITDTKQIKRLEDKETISGNASYSPPRFVFFPTLISGNYSVGYSYFRAWRHIEKMEDYIKIKDFFSLEEANSWSVQSPFQFWDILSLNPSFSRGDITEEKEGVVMRDGVTKRYLKSQSQTASVSGTLRLLNFFQPGFSYSINTNENFNLRYSTPVSFPSETKSIIRSGSAEVTWNFNFRDLTTFAHTSSLALNSSYRITDGDLYDNVASTYNVRDKLWIRDELPGLYDKRRNLTQSDTTRISGRWNPLEAVDFLGRLRPWKTLGTNFTYSKSNEFSDTTGTQRKSYTLNWPDLLFTLSEVEHLLHLEKYTSGSVINYKTASRRSETIGQISSEASNYGVEYRTNLFKKYDLNINYNESAGADTNLKLNQKTKRDRTYGYAIQTGFYLGKWRITARYDESQSRSWDGFNRLTVDNFSRKPSIAAYWDYTSPLGIRIPIIGQTLPLTNRFTFNTNFNLTQNRSSINYERGNTDTYNLNFVGDYEATANFRLAVGGGFGYHRNLVQRYEDNYQININSRLTIQF